jgi:site-specific DNA recombinase
MDSFDAYIRVSKVGDRGGSKSFISPDVQRDTVKRLAAVHGLTIGELVEELDISGSKPIDERDLGRLVRKVEEGESAGLLVWKLSRFSRSLLDGVTVADRIQRAGGRLIAEDFDSAAPMGKAMLGLLLGWAEEELDARRAGWRTAQRRAAERGVFPSRTPLGYMRIEAEGEEKGRLARLVCHSRDGGGSGKGLEPGDDDAALRQPCLPGKDRPWRGHLRRGRASRADR